MLNWLKRIRQRLLISVKTFGEIFRIAWEAHPRHFLILLFLTTLQGLETLALAWLIKLLFDRLGEGFARGLAPGFLQDLLPIILIQGMVLVLARAIEALSTFLDAELARQIILKVQASLFTKLNGFVGLRYFEDSRFHDSIEVGLQAAQSSAVGIIGRATTFVRSIVTLVSFTTVVFALSPALVGLIFLTSLPNLGAQLRVSRKQANLFVEQSPWRRRIYFYRHLLSGLGPAKEVRLFGLGNYLLGKLLNVQRQIQGKQRQVGKEEMHLKIGAGAISGTVYGIVFAAVVLQVLRGSLTLGDITLYTSAVGSVQGAIAQIGSLISGLNKDLLQFQKFNEVIALPPEIKFVGDAQPISALKTSIELREVSFRYTETSPWVLRHMNLQIPAGQCTALVGLNGSGKTTLVKLLSRLYDPDEGQILWDGRPTTAFAPDELRKHIAIIFQDFIRFDLSVQENIGFGNVSRLEDIHAIQNVSKQVGMHAVIDKLPNKYDTVLSRWLVEEGEGANFSGGEWQKIALARLLFREADLLILDEPTASLDAEAEHAIYEKLMDIVETKTTLLISHRFSTLRMADQIAVIENGRISELGSHAELMAQEQSYSKLFSLQAEKYIWS